MIFPQIDPLCLVPAVCFSANKNDPNWGNACYWYLTSSHEDALLSLECIRSIGYACCVHGAAVGQGASVVSLVQM